MDWKLLLSTFGAIFAAEMGDKTQLACILLTAESRSPWTVFMGTALALVLASLLGVVFGSVVCRYLDPGLIKKVAAVSFVVLGALIWFDKL